MNVAAILGYLTYYRYALIIPLAIVEGPIVMVLCGFLWRLGTFDLIPLYFALTAGDLIGDIIWYWVGYAWGHPFVRKFGKYFSISENMIDKMTDLFHRYNNRILFVSKITMGFGFAIVTLVAAGIARVSFKKYLLFNTVGEFIWTAMLIAVGYFFGNLYYSIDSSFRWIAVGAFVIILAAAVYGFGKFAREKIARRLI